jgi:hypothetical protein
MIKLIAVIASLIVSIIVLIICIAILIANQVKYKNESGSSESTSTRITYLNQPEPEQEKTDEIPIKSTTTSILDMNFVEEGISLLPPFYLTDDNTNREYYNGNRLAVLNLGTEYSTGNIINTINFTNDNYYLNNSIKINNKLIIVQAKYTENGETGITYILCYYDETKGLYPLITDTKSKELFSVSYILKNDKVVDIKNQMFEYDFIDIYEQDTINKLTIIPSIVDRTIIIKTEITYLQLYLSDILVSNK